MRGRTGTQVCENSAGEAPDNRLDLSRFVSIRAGGVRGSTCCYDNVGLTLLDLWDLLKSVRSTFSKQSDHEVVADQIHIKGKSTTRYAVKI
jgi:hypothetical protein